VKFNRYISKDEAFFFTGYSKKHYKWDYKIAAITKEIPNSSNNF